MWLEDCLVPVGVSDSKRIGLEPDRFWWPGGLAPVQTVPSRPVYKLLMALYEIGSSSNLHTSDLA